MEDLYYHGCVNGNKTEMKRELSKKDYIIKKIKIIIDCHVKSLSNLFKDWDFINSIRF